jgi:site-specific DNA recombinase
MKECFGYVRVSTVKQGDGVSLEAQRDAILSFASRQNITITQWFEEKETAAKRGRPIFNKMVAELRRGKACGLVVHKIDRSARNFSDWAKIGDLQDAGVDIHFATESLDFSSRGGRLTADIQAVIAADYVRNLREETIKGITARLKQGLYPFKAPIGYLDNGGGKAKTFDPQRAHYIRTAFELYASGRHSQRSLQKELGRLGLRTAEGRPLSLTGLETVLGNPFYCGIIRIKCSGEIYQGVHEPLISASLFQQVQEAKAGRTVQKMTRHDHIYRRLFRCVDCSGAMIPECQKGHVYYRCQTKDCPTKTIREEVIETSIMDCLARVRLTDGDVAALVGNLHIWLQDIAQKNAPSEALILQLAATKDRMTRLTDALIDRLIDREVFNERKAALLMEEKRIAEEMEKSERNKINPDHIRNFLELAKNLADTFFFASPAEKQQIAAMATSNRSIKGKDVYIEPANWLVEVEQTVSALCGALAPDTYRKGCNRPENNTIAPHPANIEQLIRRIEEIRRDTPRLFEKAHAPNLITTDV